MGKQCGQFRKENARHEKNVGKKTEFSLFDEHLKTVYDMAK